MRFFATLTTCIKSLGSDVYITATLKEVDELMAVNPAMIALDATQHQRPGEVQVGVAQ